MSGNLLEAVQELRDQVAILRLTLAVNHDELSKTVTNAKNIGEAEAAMKEFHSWCDPLADNLRGFAFYAHQHGTKFDGAIALANVVTLQSGFRYSFKHLDDLVTQTINEIDTFTATAPMKLLHSKNSELEASSNKSDPPITMSALYAMCIGKRNRAGVLFAGSDSTVRGWRNAKGFPNPMTWKTVRVWLNDTKNFDIGDPPTEC